MPLPTAAEITDPNATNAQMKQRLGQLAEGVDSKEEVDQKIETAKEDVLTESEQTSKEIVSQLGVGSGFSDTAVFMIVDSKGRVLPFPQSDEKGLPTEVSAIAIFNAISSRIVSQISLALSDSGLSFNDANPELVFAVTSSSGKRTWLEAGLDGLPTEWAAKCIADTVGAAINVVPDKFKSSYQNQEIKTVSGPDIICVGDSMTFGVGATTYNYPLYLKKLLSDVGSTAQVFNSGVGGESSASIAARYGANPFIVNPFTIPADTSPVAITLREIGGLAMRPLYQGNGEGVSGGGGAALRRYFDGEIAGVKGRISLVQPSAVGTVYSSAPDDYYTFTRAEVGTTVNVTRPAPFYLDYSKQHWGDIHIIWIGQNNGTDQDRAIADTKAIIQKMEALDKRYLVISKPVSSNETTTKAERDAIDAKFFAEFGRRFIPIRQYLIEYGLQDAGITATAQDNIDISNGQVPQSLRVDTVHFTTAAYMSVAQQVFNRMKELGWI